MKVKADSDADHEKEGTLEAGRNGAVSAHGHFTRVHPTCTESTVNEPEPLLKMTRRM